MNKERMLKLADFLEGLKPTRFDMSAWADRRLDPDADGGLRGTCQIDPKELVINECGTYGCIAGWAIYLFADREPSKDWPMPPGEAQILLDLTDEQAKHLFYGAFAVGLTRTQEITPTMAAAAIRKEMAFFNFSNQLRRWNIES